MLLTILLVILLLAANGFFVAAEFALVKVRPVRMQRLAEEGSLRGRLTVHILHRIDAYLAACQLGITMASLGLGWIGEPFVASLLEPAFRAMGLGEQTIQATAFLIGFLVFSSLHIVIGEQVPKTIAIREAEPVSLWSAFPLHGFYLLLFPLNWLLDRAARSILRLLGLDRTPHIEVLTADELRGLILASHRHGAMPKQERDMLDAILDLSEVEVREVMTHRRQMVTIDADRPLAEVVEQIANSPYSRFPIWRGEPDRIIGVVHAKDVLAAAWRAAPDTSELDLESLASPPWFIPETTSLLHQLLAFRKRREHLALVVDEYGSLLGLVTLEDILEEIVGEIVDERDVETAGIQVEADGAVLVEGRVTIRDLNRRMDWNLPEEEAATVAGLVIAEAERIPEPGERFVFHGFEFEVLRRQRHQLTLLRVRPAGGASRPHRERPAD